MAKMLLAVTFVIMLFFGYRLMGKLDQFLNSGRIENEDPEIWNRDYRK